MSDNIPDRTTEQPSGRESLSSRAQRVIGRTLDIPEEHSAESCMYTATLLHISILSLKMENWCLNFVKHYQPSTITLATWTKVTFQKSVCNDRGVERNQKSMS
jgi:hypothetical protein